MNIVYVVLGTFSSWDSYHERNLKAFKDKDEADEYVVKANRVLANMSNHIAKLQELQDLDKEEYDDMSVDEIMDAQDKIEETEEFKLAIKVWGFHRGLQEFNECKIDEIELI